MPNTKVIPFKGLSVSFSDAYILLSLLNVKVHFYITNLQRISSIFLAAHSFPVIKF